MDFLSQKELSEPKKTLKSAIFLLYLLYSKLPRRVTREKSPQGLKQSVPQKETVVMQGVIPGVNFRFLIGRNDSHGSILRGGLQTQT